MKDKTKTLLTGEIQVTPFDPIFAELDHMMFSSKNLYNVCLYMSAVQKVTTPWPKTRILSICNSLTY